jgi:hypothetical protein
VGGCDSSLNVVGPAPVPTPNPLMVFTDSASGFSTTDIRDADGDTVQLTRAGELVWTADGSRFPVTIGVTDAPESLVIIHTNDFGTQVRFQATEGGQGAYLTWLDDVHYPPLHLADVEIVHGTLVVTESDVLFAGH